MIDNKQIAEALRLAATYLGSGLHDNAVESLQRQANALDPPPYELDRSLRGWVMVRFTDSRQSVYHAGKFGLTASDNADARVILSWDDAEHYRYKVTKLNILQPDEVAVSIPPTSEWPHGCEFIRIALLFESATGRTTNVERILDREQVERMEAE